MMEILYFEEKRSENGWRALQSEYPDIRFTKVNDNFQPKVGPTGQRFGVFVHFKDGNKEERFKKEFPNFYTLKKYKINNNSIFLFGPDHPHGILKSDFNDFIMKNKEIFKDADLITIKRNDEFPAPSMNCYNACKKFLRSVKNGHEEREESTSPLSEETES